MTIRTGHRLLLQCLLSALALLIAPASLNAQPRPRITQRVDGRRLTPLPRTTHPLTSRARDLGRVPADLPMERIVLQLAGTPEQDAALEQLLADQQDPSSPRFRQWLTPEEFGERFGPAQSDIDAVAQWLESQGLRIGAVARGRRSLECSGTAGDVERAFATEMHRYEWNGERHVANARDLSLPAALAGVVAGVASLHDFRRQPMHRVLSAAPPVALANLSGGAHALGPYDFATIYDVSPLWAQNFDGAGQTVAIAGRTNIRPTDIASFRGMFGLPANPPQVVLNGADPGIVGGGEEMEADLDVEWSGAVAKGALVKFVVSKSTNASDGVDLSNQYIVNDNLAAAMSVSFGLCEAYLGSGNAFYNALWQQAAAQGISVFVSSGDNGAAGCDSPSSTAPASHGLAVNGLGSTPYNVAVGGTQFADTINPTAYWNSANDSHQSSARSYIPETAWNESAYVSAGSSANNLYAGSGGVSTLYATPSWQAGPGVPAGDPAAPTQHHRYLPDVSLAAAGHDGYLVVHAGGLYMVGGTSASSPAFAGLMAIVDQYTGGRNGNPNTRLYSLAIQAPTAFHDIATGTIAVPCASGSPNCSKANSAAAAGLSAGYAAGTGYDLATGLGSVNAFVLASNWGARPATTLAISSLSPATMTGSSSAQSLTISGSGFAAGATVSASYSGASAPTQLAVASLSASQIVTSIHVSATPRVWTVKVTSPNGTFATASLTVTTLPPAPTIASLNPNPMAGSSSYQVLAINGTGFVAGNALKVVMGYPGGSGVSLTGGQIAFVNSTQVLALVNVGLVARTWTVQVINPDGTATAAASLTVTAPPAIASLAPNPLTRSASAQTLTINGSGFTAGAALRVLLSYPGYSTTLQGSALTSVGGSQIKALVNVGNTLRTWTVQVINPNGVASLPVPLTVK